VRLTPPPKKKKNARVVVRLRPLSSGEREAKAAAAAGRRCAHPTPCGKGLTLSGVGNASSTAATSATAATAPTAAAASSPPTNDASSFSFPDGVLGEGATQQQTYDSVAEVVDGVLLGKSASIVAYGEKEA